MYSIRRLTASKVGSTWIVKGGSEYFCMHLSGREEGTIDNLWVWGWKTFNHTQITHNLSNFATVKAWYYVLYIIHMYVYVAHISIAQSLSSHPATTNCPQRRDTAIDLIWSDTKLSNHTKPGFLWAITRPRPNFTARSVDRCCARSESFRPGSPGIVT